MKELCLREDPRLPEVPTQVGSSEKHEETCSGAQGYPHVGSFDKSQKFRHLEVPAQVRTSDRPN
jgi:hypothetical protein